MKIRQKHQRNEELCENFFKKLLVLSSTDIKTIGNLILIQLSTEILKTKIWKCEKYKNGQNRAKKQSDRH